MEEKTNRYKTRKEINKIIRDQIIAIRDSGETNMLDTSAVQYIANREGYFELVNYLEDYRNEYYDFILRGMWHDM